MLEGQSGSGQVGTKKVGRLYDGRRDRPVAWWQSKLYMPVYDPRRQWGKGWDHPGARQVPSDLEFNP
jgi:hypothetical protein